MEILPSPAWTSLSYDRMPPSPSIMSQRVHGLGRLAEGISAPLIPTGPRAGLLPEPRHWQTARVSISPGDPLDEAEFRKTLAQVGYQVDEHVDQPGEVAMRGHVIEIFPGGGATPVRIELAGGRVETLHTCDPVT